MRRERHPLATPDPLLHTLCLHRGPVGERPACQSVAGQRVKVNMHFSPVENLGKHRLVECMGERERQRVFSLKLRGLKSLFLQ